MQDIWIVKISENDTVFIKERMLAKLPETFLNRANRYLDMESSLSFLTGRLLLKKAVVENGLSTSLLEEIQYSNDGKPSFIAHNFSISHSNWYVVLVFGTKFSVGIDIEMKKQIDLKLFNYLFTKTEWKAIMEAEHPLDKFYWFWVRKEALLKAAGCALKDLKQLEVHEHHGVYKEKRYYFTPFDFDAGFNGVVAIEENLDFNVEWIALKDLLEE